jgi:hypothetical protein
MILGTIRMRHAASALIERRDASDRRTGVRSTKVRNPPADALTATVSV